MPQMTFPLNKEVYIKDGEEIEVYVKFKFKSELIDVYFNIKDSLCQV